MPAPEATISRTASRPSASIAGSRVIPALAAAACSFWRVREPGSRMTRGNLASWANVRVLRAETWKSRAAKATMEVEFSLSVS